MTMLHESAGRGIKAMPNIQLSQTSHTKPGTRAATPINRSLPPSTRVHSSAQSSASRHRQPSAQRLSLLALRQVGCPRDASSRLQCSAEADSTVQSLAETADTMLRVSLPTEDAQRSITLALSSDGPATTIVVSSVAIGSASEEAGVLRGQRLFQISDPIRATEMWVLNDRPSIRFVRDALLMRRSDSIELVLSREATAPESVGILESTSSSISSSGPGMTIGERLVQQQKKAEIANADLTAMKLRQQRRLEYMEAEAGRNDSSFLAWTFAAFVLPALVILIIAFSTGYLDKVAGGYGGM